jgi:YgiT-type zinc finger domain-containing protein
MECVICKNGRTKQGFVTVTLERKGSIIVIKEVNAEICDNCGEYYLDEKTTKEVLNKAEVAFKNGAEIEVLKMQKIA